MVSSRCNRLGLLLVALQCAAIRPVSAQDPTYEANPKCPSMKIRDFITYISTESAIEFDLSESVAEELGMSGEQLITRAQGLWDASTKFEFARTKRAEVEEDGQAFPFILCHQDADGGGDDWESYLRPAVPASAGEEDGSGGTTVRRKSGYQRMEEIRGAVSAAAANLTLAGFDDVKLKTMYNQRGGYCGIAILPGSVAEAVEYDSCVVQPMTMPTKVAGGTVEIVTRLLEKYYNFTDVDVEETDIGGLIEDLEAGESEDQRIPSVTITLCHGVLSNEMIESMRGGSETEEFEVTQIMTAWLLSTTESEEMSALNIADNLYWTGRDDAEGETSVRGEFWQQVFDAVSEEDACHSTFRTGLKWTLEPGYDEKEFSNLHVRYTKTKEESNDIDSYCILAMLAGLAIRPDVCFFEINPEKSEQSTSVQWLTQTGFQNEAPWTDIGLNGTGQVVALSDTGLDIDNCYFWDKEVGSPGENHRKVVSYNPGYGDSSDQEGGHGTHVAGIIVGKRATDGINEESGKGDGVAPGAKVAFLDTQSEDGYGYLPDSELLAIGRDGTNKARIHSASWSTPGWNLYSAQSRNFDDFTVQNDDLLVVVAAGNAGRYDKASSVLSPATAKNIMTVGASHSSGTDVGNMLGSAYVADFSGKGPTLDGRIAPDVVAPGKFILAAGAQPGHTGECDPDDGTVPEVGYNKFKDGLKYDGGTSMATPVVSGTAALILEYFQEGWYPEGVKDSGESISPSASLVKAILMNGAQTSAIKGVDNLSSGVTPAKAYDGNMGFGRINLLTSLYVKGKSNVQAEIWDRQKVADGETKTYTVEIDKSAGCESKELSATLAWFEEGSSSNCLQCLLNDLDLFVTKNGDDTIKYYPNGRSEKDSANTVERVIVDGVTTGDTLTLHVVGDNLSKASQSFALVATGCFGGVKSEYGEGFVPQSGESEGNNAGNGTDTTTIIIIVISVLAGIAIVTLGVLFWRKRRNEKAYTQ